jgi:fatty-acyl-CoA synthase
MEAFRGRAFLGPVYELCPELARAAPGALHSDRLPGLRAVITIDERRHDGVHRWDDAMALSASVPAGGLTAAAAAVRPTDPCFVLYTSGSTATPKGVVLAHGGIIGNGFDIGERQHLGPADRLWLSVPLFGPSARPTRCRPS